MSKEILNIDEIEKNQEKLLENTKKTLEDEIEKIKMAKEQKALENRIKDLEKEIEEIKKFLANDGYNKQIEIVKKRLEEFNTKESIKLRGKPTLVDFWADWCAPCKMIGHVVHQLQEKYKDTLNVVKIDTETKVGDEMFKAYATPSGVNAIPYLLVFDKDGNLFESLVGADPNRLTQIVEAVLKK
ncbi:MAG: thioredoxin domain-containing protein [Candidatus Helarchaeota archaeon]